jgi:hypothetical protein
MTDVVVVSDQQAVIVEVGAQDAVIVETGFQGPPGAPGSSGNGSAVIHAFAWGDATPATIIYVPAGKMVFKVEVILKTPFDGESMLTIGDILDNARLLGADDIDLTVVGTYQTNPGFTYAEITSVNVYLALGGGISTGSGLILIYIQE